VNGILSIRTANGSAEPQLGRTVDAEPGLGVPGTQQVAESIPL